MNPDPNDERMGEREKKISELIEALFAVALEQYRCIECARLDIAQRARLIAEAKLSEMFDIECPEYAAGGDWESVTEEMKADRRAKLGYTRVCDSCQKEPPPGSVRFFKHGTDELLK